jgi:hypothetical protein
LNEKCGWTIIKENGYNVGLMVARKIGTVDLGK